ncbi:TIGR03885 family FMN-dependent LLM class oxidoreductase [Myxacorys almedinensis]|uniref:TIGR03885 family FMN-dependent LLM class oxidoreductase n=1 Tax=Myxacorys almedinensis A TaxID=2690445 RepID=A0A8J8CI52_9CYAN|nr:TIGR03885 family FMN-dependent LLM class oxidoreductase [Myxacorys almedinensis]NDJ17374.1 TIGR03885 family FMN-dependent LLM class oxidoreductase [Myxacorys almedinensis A]
MVKVGYHASHEQFKPSALLKYAQLAEQAGFSRISCSDHFHPWSERQGESGFAWAWLGAALQATSLPFGVVCAPGQRYHPAIVAQAAATLAELFPERFWIAIGSGQALNELITGDRWLPKEQRNARLKECADVMRSLWAGETITHDGFVRIEEAKLYTRPIVLPQMMGAAITPQTAKWVGSWADGLITISQPLSQLKAVVESFRQGGGDGKPMYLKVQLSYASSDAIARELAYDQWRTNIFQSSVLTDLRSPQQFDLMAELVEPHDMDTHVNISSEPEQHVEWLQHYIELGFDELYLHNVNREQQRFIEVFGEQVLSKVTNRDPAFQ